MPAYFRVASPAAGGATPPSRFSVDAHAAILVAEAANAGDSSRTPALIGAVTVRVYDTPSQPAMVPRRRAHVEALVVDHGHRRAGVGTALMEAATVWARGRGASEIVLTVWAGNAAGDAFYERLGYRVVSRALGKTI